MKRLIIIALTIVFGVVFSESFSKKPKKAEMTEAQKEEIRLQEEKELQELQHEMRLDSIRMAKQKAELQRLKEESEQYRELENSRPRPYRSVPSYEEIEAPCQEEAKNTDEYYGAWAVSSEQVSQSQAIQDAVQKAQVELARQVGGENVVLDGVEVVCRKISVNSRGVFIAYVAVRMPKSK